MSKSRMFALIMFSALLLLPACNQIDSEGNDLRVEYKEGTYYNKDWDNIEFPVTDVNIPAIEYTSVADKETAISIANMIFDELQNNGRYKNFSMQQVFFDIPDEIWIVSFWETRGGYLGSDFSIAISKNDARIIKMWINE